MQNGCRSSRLYPVPIRIRRNTLLSYWTKSGRVALLDDVRNRNSTCKCRYIIR